MADEEPSVVDSVTEATNGIGSEALAAITNLGGSSGTAAGSVLSRIGATISGRTGGFAPKVITTVTKHGLAAIDRVKPIQGVDRGYRAVARDVNGLETIHTILDLDPREYDVTVTREDGVALVEFVQQEPEPEAALPPGDTTQERASTADSDQTAKPVAPVKGTDSANASERTHRGQKHRGGAVGVNGSGHVQPATVGSGAAAGHDVGVQEVRAEAEKAKAEAEAEKAKAEAEKARAEAAAAKARAEAERAKAEADTEAVRNERRANIGDERSGPNGRERSQQGASTQQGGVTETTETTETIESTETAGSWGLRDDAASESQEQRDREHAGRFTNESGNDDFGTESDDGEGNGTEENDDGFGGFTPATPVEDEPPEYTDGGTIETTISVHDQAGEGSAVADGGTDEECEAEENTGRFVF